MSPDFSCHFLGVVFSIKLVKCKINDELPCDISVNALGGVGSLAFMEEADDHIGRDHLLKKSIMLIKSWLVYENEIKILKSPEGLLSTYGLEVMILYIINKFHVEINSPIECLRKFLRHFMETERVDHPILDQQFVKECRRKYCVGSSSAGSFHQRMINIADPMDPNNNVGKSIQKKDEFIRGIVEGNIKMSKIGLSGEMVGQFPVLTGGAFARSGGQSELLDLKGDDWSKTVEEARKCYTMIYKKPNPHHRPSRSTPSRSTPMSPHKSNSDPEKREIYDVLKEGMCSSPRGGGTVKPKEMEGVLKLSSTFVFKFATASPPQVLKIDPSALARLSSGHKPSAQFKLPFLVPNFLTREEARASILVLRNTLLFRGGSSAASQLSDILNKDAQSLTFDLEFDHQDDLGFYKNCWPDIIIRAICALSGHVASSLSILADVCAALSCEALKTNPTTAFNSFTDSGDGFSDQDRASVASDFKALLHGSKIRGGNTQCIDVFVDIPRTHGRLRSLCKSIHSSTLVELNSVPLLHGRAGKDLTGFFSSLAFALESLGEGSRQRAKLCLDNLVKDNLFPHLAESFTSDCPNDKLKVLIKAFFASEEEQNYIKSLHEVYSLSEAVRKILSWEATISFISLEGSELIKVKEVVADGDKKKDKKKKALGKGTAVLMQFIKDRLQSGTRDFSKEQMAVREKALSIVANVFERHGATALDTPMVMYLDSEAPLSSLIVRAPETQVLVSIFGEDLSLAAKLVNKCWRANLKARFLVNKRVSKHFDRAKEFGIPWIVMVGEQETSRGVVTLKNKDAGVEKRVRGSDFVEELVSLINSRQS
nr:histidine--tRNA ligase, cytoplasmic [Tanacetum cinerariifolium]